MSRARMADETRAPPVLADGDHCISGLGQPRLVWRCLCGWLRDRHPEAGFRDPAFVLRISNQGETVLDGCVTTSVT